jgi:DNA invertase Pin-like site-specific DNA recombinase
MDTSNYQSLATELIARAARAAELRKLGMSHRAVASALGMTVREARACCAGIQPVATLPDLPGLPSLRETHPDVIAKIRQMRADGHSVSDTARAVGASTNVVMRYGSAKADLIARAVDLRMRGLSVLSVASALGMSYEAAMAACDGVEPPITLPDLPGVTVPTDIAPRKPQASCTEEVIAKIRQMREDRHTRANIARALGVSVATVANYAPFGQNTRPAGTDGRVKMTPETHREIHRLRFVEFLSYDKIAVKTGLSVITVRRYVKIPPQ